MTANQKSRILRNYRNMAPTKFHVLNQKVSIALSDNAKIPESTWAANPTLLSSYLTVSAKHDAVYHEANYGSRLVISERDVLQAQLVNYLDEIALVLEAAALHTPDILISSCFDLTKDRRTGTRTKAAATSTVSTTEHQEQHD